GELGAQESGDVLARLSFVFVSLGREPEPRARAVARELDHRDHHAVEARIAHLVAQDQVHLFADQLLQPHRAGAVAVLSFMRARSVLLSLRLADDTRLPFAAARFTRRAHPSIPVSPRLARRQPTGSAGERYFRTDAETIVGICVSICVSFRGLR